MQTIENVINVSGAAIISLNTVTDVTLAGGKKNPLQGRVTKKTTGSNVMVFANKNVNGYAEMVKRHLEKEGKNPDSFKLGDRVWGERIAGTPFVAHKGKKYMEVIFLSAGKTEYIIDGVPASIDSIQGLGQPDISESSQGGLDNKVIVRTYAVDSIKSLKVGSETFIF